MDYLAVGARRMSPPDLKTIHLKTAVNEVLEARKRRAAHLRSLDELHVVAQIEKIHGLITTAQVARRFMGAHAGNTFLERAQDVAIELLGIPANESINPNE
jgi:hypothetical protein